MTQFSSDIAFTPAVKAIQTEKGSRAAYANVERSRGWRTTVTPELREFLSGMDMFYLETANAEGRPYIQYRGGSPGFLKVVDDYVEVEDDKKLLSDIGGIYFADFKQISDSLLAESKDRKILSKIFGEIEPQLKALQEQANGEFDATNVHLKEFRRELLLTHRIPGTRRSCCP